MRLFHDQMLPDPITGMGKHRHSLAAAAAASAGAMRMAEFMSMFMTAAGMTDTINQLRLSHAPALRALNLIAVTTAFTAGRLFPFFAAVQAFKNTVLHFVVASFNLD